MGKWDEIKWDGIYQCCKYFVGGIGIEILKTVAVSRIILDNIPHIKAYWPTFTINLALVAQNFGADDIDGTIEKESIQSGLHPETG